jgi:8-amino-7-oxononanoate synthase
MNFDARDIEVLMSQHLLRSLSARPATGGKFVRDGRTVLNFSSNDYLNLANDRRLKEAAIQAVEKYGCGAGASRLMSGHLELHEKLEAALAKLTGRPAALVFGSGFLTNLGVITSLARRGDAIFADRLNHASLVDAARLSGARLHRYRHGDAEHLEILLKKESGKRRRIVVTDSVFSMDGDLAPLEAIGEIARRHGALLAIDEAHAIGVLGTGGGGLCRELPTESQPDAVIGTLSKALGSYGGFVACSEEMKMLFVNKARSFIYSTGLPPAAVAAGLRAVEIVETEPALGRRVMEKTRRFAEHLDLLIPKFEIRNSIQIRNLNDQTEESPAGGRLPHCSAASPILPLMVGDNRKALELMEALEKRDVLAVAVRPPTVPAGTARLRLSVTLAHSDEDLGRAAELIGEAAREVGLA